MNKYKILMALILLTGKGLMAQTVQQTNGNAADSLLNSIHANNKNEPVVIFKSTRLILSQSTKMVKKNNFNFEVIHRLGDFAGKNGGGQFFYGFDDIADVTLRFEYGLSDNLNVDFERSTIGGLADGELKYALFHQTAGGGSPVAVTLLAEAGVKPYSAFPDFSSRLSYFGQVLIARRFSSYLSIQAAPSFVRDNSPYPLISGVEKQFFAINASAALQLTRHLGILADYAHSFSSFRNSANGFYDPIGLGIQLETGGHVFTINVTNARAISEINYLSNTESDFTKGQCRIGFTISRMFDFNHKEAYK